MKVHYVHEYMYMFAVLFSIILRLRLESRKFLVALPSYGLLDLNNIKKNLHTKEEKSLVVCFFFFQVCQSIRTYFAYRKLIVDVWCTNILLTVASPYPTYMCIWIPFLYFLYFLADVDQLGYLAQVQNKTKIVLAPGTKIGVDRVTATSVHLFIFILDFRATTS